MQAGSNAGRKDGRPSGRKDGRTDGRQKGKQAERTAGFLALPFQQRVSLHLPLPRLVPDVVHLRLALLSLLCIMRVLLCIIHSPERGRCGGWRG